MRVAGERFIGVILGVGVHNGLRLVLIDCGLLVEGRDECGEDAVSMSDEEADGEGEVDGAQHVPSGGVSDEELDAEERGEPDRGPPVEPQREDDCQ